MKNKNQEELKKEIGRRKRLKPILKNEIEALINILEGRSYYAGFYRRDLVLSLKELKRRMYKK